MKRVLWLLLFGWMSVASAQTMDSPIEYPIVFSAVVTENPNNHYPQLVAGLSTAAIGVIQGSTLLPSATIRMIPGKAYTLSGMVAQTEGFRLSFVAPAGMRIYVNGIPSTSFYYRAPEPLPSQFSTPVNYSCSVRLEYLWEGQRLPDSPAGLAAGQATSIVDDKAIWYLGLGRTRTGGYAGAVGFRRANIADSDFFTTAALFYEPIDPSEVSVIRVSNVLRQIFAREVLVDIQTVNSTSYRLSVYPRSQVGSLSGGLYTLSGSPVITYTVSKTTPSGGIGVRIDRVEDGQTTWTSLEQVNQTVTHRGWRRAAATANSYTTTNFTSSTAATVSATGPKADNSGTETPYTWNKTYTAYSWGKELAQTTRGAGQSVPLTSQYSYYTTNNTSGAYSQQLEWQINPDGSWTKYLYYAADTGSATAARVQRVYESWLDSSPTSPVDASTSNSKYTDWTYENVSRLGGWAPKTTETRAPGGTMIGKSAWEYTADASQLNGHYTVTAKRDDYSSATEKVTTITRSISVTDSSSYYAGRSVSQTFADGRKDSYAYYFGTWNPSTRTFTASATGEDRLELVFHGQTTAGTQTPAGVSVASWTVGSTTWTLDSLYMAPTRSTVSETIVDTTGRTVFVAENVFTASSTLERITATQYRFDSHGRLTDEVDVMRSVGSNEVKTARTYEGALPATVTAADGTVAAYGYDDLLRLIQTTEGQGGPTAYPAKIKQTKYDGANRAAQTYTCSCSTTFTSLYYDAAGRLDYKVETSPNQGGELLTNYSYDSVRQTTTIQPNNATRIEVSYMDGRAKSVTGTASAPVYYEYGVSATGIWTRTGHVAPNGTLGAQTLGWEEVQADWLGRPVRRSSPTYQWSGSDSNSKVIDVASTYSSTGQLTRERTTLRSTGNRLVPDKLFVYGADGRLQRTGLDVDESGTLTDVSNDRISRQDQYYSKDSWGWTSISSTYVAPETSGGVTLEASNVTTRLTGFNGGQMHSSGVWVIGETVAFDAADRSTSVWEYIQPSAKKRWTTVTQDGATQSGTTTWINGYAADSVSPTGAKSVQDFDSKGRLSHQYSNFNGTGYETTTTYSYYGDTEYVNSVTTGSLTTTYAYGWGTTSGARVVAVTDGAGKVTRTAFNAMDLPWRAWGSGASPAEYAYDSLGRRTSVKTWRSGDFTGTSWPTPAGGDATTWALEQATGLLQTKTYADGKQVGYTYNLLGQLATRTSARGIVTTFGYYDASTTGTGDVSHRTGELRSVSYSDGTPAVGYTYKRSGLPAQVTDATGTRTFAYRSDLQLDTETLPSGFYGSNRILQSTFDAAKPWRPTGFQFKNNGTVEAAALATFDPTTGRVTTLAGAGATVTLGYKPYTDWVQTLTAGSYVQTRTLQTGLPVLQQVTTAWGATTYGNYSGTLNSRGLRETQVLGGTLGGGSTNTYSYDDRGQLNGSTNNSNAARNFSWGFDLAGNRTAQNNNGAVTTYGTGAADGSANNVNQYTSITGTQAESGLHHDNEGNMDADGTWNCTFDGENRLTQMARKDGTKTLQFVYDYLGRRVKKTVRNGGPTAAVAASTKFVWNGWKLVAELDAGTSETGAAFAKTYLWGPDFSGGAGAGGLLAVRQGGATYYPVNDLHGNVTGYLDASGGVAASFEYNTAGQVIASSGNAAGFAFGHATQYTDRESGWVYFGLRYYNPKHGRFVNRDPIEEQGGLNLYAYCGNAGPNAWDILGLSCTYEYTDSQGDWYKCSRGTTPTDAEKVRPEDRVTQDGAVILPPLTVTADRPAGPRIIFVNLPGDNRSSDTNQPTTSQGTGSGGGQSGGGSSAGGGKAKNEANKPKKENDCTRAFDGIATGIPALPEAGRLRDSLNATGIDSDNTLLALAGYESNFNAKAVNPDTKATGLYQFLASTKRDLENRIWPIYVSSNKNLPASLTGGPLVPSGYPGDWRTDPGISATAAYTYLLYAIGGSGHTLEDGLKNYHGGSAASNATYAAGVLAARDIIDGFAKKHGGNLREALENDCDAIKSQIGALH